MSKNKKVKRRFFIGTLIGAGTAWLLGRKPLIGVDRSAKVEGKNQTSDVSARYYRKGDHLAG